MAVGLGGDSHLLHAGLVLAVQGLGFAFFSSPNMTMVMNAVPPNRTSIASALSATARSLGMVSGMLIVGALISVKPRPTTPWAPTRRATSPRCTPRSGSSPPSP